MHTPPAIAFFLMLFTPICTSLLFNTHKSVADSYQHFKPYIEIGNNPSLLALHTQPAALVERHGLLALDTRPATLVERHGLLALDTWPAMLVERHGLLALDTQPATLVERHGLLALYTRAGGLVCAPHVLISADQR